jgi:uncharacterized protein YdhG (YjbR/CyaY superfamily)
MPKRSWFFCRHFILPSTAFLLGCGWVAIGSRLAEGQESVLEQVADAISGFSCTKSALHFPFDSPLPRVLVELLINTRLAELAPH